MNRGSVARGAAALDQVDDLGGEVGTTQSLDFLQAGGAGYVYLREQSADYIQAGKVYARFGEQGLYRTADFVFALADLGRHHAAAHVQVAAQIVCARHPAHGTGRTAFEIDQARVAFARSGQVTLGHDLATGERCPGRRNRPAA